MDQTSSAREGRDAPAQLRRGTANLLLGSLSPGDFALLAPHLQRVPFAIGAEIARAGEPIESVCFPEAGIAGILDAADDGQRYAIALVGREGMVGWPLLLGDDAGRYDVAMRAEGGEALRMEAEPFRAAVDTSATLRRALLRFTDVLMIQMGRTIVSALAHSIERRMARWILLYHDRVQGDAISMTHEEFGLMLGVRRSSVTEALHRLEEDGAIRAQRGRVVVRSREGLLDLAGSTYGPAERAYRRLVLGTPE